MDQVTSVEVSHRRHDLEGKGATKKTREVHVGGSCFIGPITTTSSSPCGLFIPIKREFHPTASTPTQNSKQENAHLTRLQSEAHLNSSSKCRTEESIDTDHRQLQIAQTKHKHQKSFKIHI
jgi:hypothetical protein